MKLVSKIYLPKASSGVSVYRGNQLATISCLVFMLCSEAAGGAAREHIIPVRDVFIEVLGRLRDSLPAHLHRSRGHRFAFYYSKNAYFGHELFTRIRKEPEIDGMIARVREYYDARPGESVLIARPDAAGRSGHEAPTGDGR